MDDFPDVLLEREHEIQRIRDVLHAAGQRDGAAIVVEGAAGIGKSRLLEVARTRAVNLGFRVLTARGTELEQGFPFGVARQLFERLLREADETERARWLSGAAALSAEVLLEAPAAAPSAASNAAGNPGYAWLHGLYWLTSNLANDAPLAVLVDDLQWCDTPSTRALAFVARRLEGQPIALILATRPPEPEKAADAAALVSDPAGQILRPAPLTDKAVASLVSARFADEPDRRFLQACREMTGGNPFLVRELLEEAHARGLQAGASTAALVATLVPRGVTHAVLLRLARLAPPAVALARALSALGDGAQVSDAARLAGLTEAEVAAHMDALVSVGVVEPGASVRFVHPLLRAAIYGDLSAADRQRLHREAARIMRARGAPSGHIAAHLMHTEPSGDEDRVTLLRDAAREALVMGDATGAANLFKRALAEPPSQADRPGVVLELGLALARAGAPDAVEPLTEIVERDRDSAAITTAALELSGMLFYAGRPAEAVVLARRAQARLRPASAEHERLEVALLGWSYTSASARQAAEETIAGLRDPGGPAQTVLQATVLATLAMDEVAHLGSAPRAIDLARRALAVPLPVEPHRGESWAMLALATLVAADELDAARRGTDEVLTQARQRGAALTVATISALRAVIGLRSGELSDAQADAETAIDLASELLGKEFLVLAVTAAVFAGLERGESTDSLRRLIQRSGVAFDPDFLPGAQLLHATAALRAAAGNHEAAVDALRSCAGRDPTFGGENPAMVAWRSSAALSLSELGRYEEARNLAADEVRRAREFGAPRALGIALRTEALVGSPADRPERLAAAHEALAESPARLEQARVLTDLGATLRAGGQRSAAREPLLEALALASRCGAQMLELRARSELAAIGLRPRRAARTGTDGLTPSERRVVELAATGGTNREIAQTLFVTEKTVETHLGRAFRKLDVSSRRQLADVLASASG